MKGQFSHLNLSYVEAEDRILMTVGTSENEEIRYWVTRLYTRHLFGMLERLLNGDGKRPEHELALERQRINHAQQQQSQQNQAADRGRKRKSRDEPGAPENQSPDDPSPPDPKQPDPKQPDAAASAADQGSPADQEPAKEPPPEKPTLEKSFPVGQEPALLVKLVIQPLESRDSDSEQPRRTPDTYVLKMHPPEGGVGVDLCIDRSLMFNICELLSQIEKQHEWNLNLKIPGANASTRVVSSNQIH